MNKDAVLGLIRHILTAVGGGIVAKGAVDESAMTDIVGGLILIAGAVWSIIDKRTRKPQVPTVPLLLLLASVAFVGCQTTNPAGRALATASITAEDAVNGWLVYVETSGQVTPEQEAKVEAAYERFRVAKHIAMSAYSAATKAGDLSVYDRAFDALEKSKADLLKLISDITTPKPKPQASVYAPNGFTYVIPQPGWQELIIDEGVAIYGGVHEDGSACLDLRKCKETFHTIPQGL